MLSSAAAFNAGRFEEMEMTLNLAPLAFAVNNLTDINDVERRLESEAGLFAEIKDVLKRYGAEKKYGIALLHKHFDLAEDEVLMEYTDIETRTLVSKATKRDDISLVGAIETVWSLDSDAATTGCAVFCFYNREANQHVPQHRATAS
jgi:hypothetical protein